MSKIYRGKLTVELLTHKTQNLHAISTVLKTNSSSSQHLYHRSHFA